MSALVAQFVRAERGAERGGRPTGRYGLTER